MSDETNLGVGGKKNVSLPHRKSRECSRHFNLHLVKIMLPKYGGHVWRNRLLAIADGHKYFSIPFGYCERWGSLVLLVVCTLLFFRMQNSSFECLGHDRSEMARTIARNFLIKFPYSPILHYAFSSWIEKTMTKTNTFPLGKQIYFTIVWGCAEILLSLTVISWLVELSRIVYQLKRRI